MITPEQIKALAKAMHANGVVSLKTPEIELLIQPKQPQIRRRRSKSPEIPKIDETLNGSGFRGYTDEELLTWSSAPIEG